MNCREISTAPACYTDATGIPVTVIAHYEYGSNADGDTILVATRYTDAAGTPIDTSAGAVVAGACAAIPADVEFVQLCDVQADGTVIEFIRRSITTFAADGTPTTVTADFDLDKVTPYAPAGTVGACAQDCDPATPVGVVATWG